MVGRHVDARQGPCASLGRFIASHEHARFASGPRQRPGGGRRSHQARERAHGKPALRQASAGPRVHHRAIHGRGGTLHGASELGSKIRCAIPLQPWEPGTTFARITAPTLFIGAEADTVAAVAENATVHYASIPSSVERIYAEFKGADQTLLRRVPSERRGYSSWSAKLSDLAGERLMLVSSVRRMRPTRKRGRRVAISTRFFSLPRDRCCCCHCSERRRAVLRCSKRQ